MVMETVSKSWNITCKELLNFTYTWSEHLRRRCINNSLEVPKDLARGCNETIVDYTNKLFTKMEDPVLALSGIAATSKPRRL